MLKSIINQDVNKFALCKLCSGKDLYRRVGSRNVPINASGSKDEYVEPLSMNSRKIDILENMDAYDKYMQTVEKSRNDPSVDQGPNSGNTQPLDE